ncbi:MAG: LuxR C-terminal-related transcriptional regulator [Gaiellaceae bacterium]
MSRQTWLGADIGESLAAINAPAYVLDRDGVIRWMNARAIELFGDHRGSAFTAPVASEAESIARLEFTKKMLRTARTSDYETVLLLRSGERVPAEIHSVSIVDGGKVVGIFGIVEIVERGRPRQSRPSELTPRQHEVLLLLARGCSTRQIAESLGLSIATVRNHVSGLLRALSVNSRIEALIEGRRRGLID